MRSFGVLVSRKGVEKSINFKVHVTIPKGIIVHSFQVILVLDSRISGKFENLTSLLGCDIMGFDEFACIYLVSACTFSLFFFLTNFLKTAVYL